MVVVDPGNLRQAISNQVKAAAGGSGDAAPFDYADYGEDCPGVYPPRPFVFI